MTKTAEATEGRATGKPSRSPLVERAYREIKQCILVNVFKPNRRILEQDLAQRLGMSRTPVREAVIRLEKEGLVEVMPRRGMRILPVSPDDMREIHDVLACLEARAAQRLAERHPSAAEIAPLTEALDAMIAGLDADDLTAWAAADDRFHRLLLELCGNKRLAAMALTVFDQAHRARTITLHMRPAPHRSNEDRRAVLDAILAGDGRRAHDLHFQHRHGAMLLLTEILKRHNLREL